jgi:antitoxin YefM
LHRPWALILLAYPSFWRKSVKRRLDSRASPFPIDKIKITTIMTIYRTNAVRRFGMLTIQDYIPVTKAKSKLLDIIRKIESSDDTVAITKNGVPEAVLLSMSKFEGLVETLEVLSDETAMKSIRKSIKEAREGKWLDFDEVFGE